MKKLIITLYVATVLAIALIAQASSAADFVTLSGSYVAVSKDSSKVLIAGRYPNPCVSNARLVVETISKDTILFKVVANKLSEVCTSVLGKGFKFVQSTKSLKTQLEDLNLDPSGIYNVVSENGRLNAIVDFSKAVETDANEFTTMISTRGSKGPGIEMLF